MPLERGPVLEVGGARYGGWTRLRVGQSIEHAAGAFEVQLTERWPGSAEMPLVPGLECTLRLHGQVVITGWIDGVSRDLGPTMRTVSIAGRDRSAEIVDCSAEVKQYQGITLEAMAKDQCAPYRVAVQVSAGLDEPFGRVAVDPGQTVWEFIEELARQRGALVMSDGQGGIRVGHPVGDKAPSALIEGGNLLGVRMQSDWKDRYSDYIVRGQSAGDDDWHGKAAAQEEAVAIDPVVSQSRYRPLIIIAESTEQDLERRAQWEMRTRYGRSLKASGMVQGWEAAPGALWRAGMRVDVDAASLKLQEALLIVGLTYQLDEGGTTTDMQLARPEAYDPKGAPPGTGKDGKRRPGGDLWK